ncbi:hypothetical protein K505DRAFT_333796 [Melanomma pulvis-pyrius CBS 109.77]|uniref:Uncharacterized protein n=1 Tax=Melanomma pulvis-pyrius CBS 109.77 TaxID=1314802 RepID=A0A6A6XP86_9PLEO|nr:hypothetical protein K505DRAFT_333796 [Melanomma pulvis-pyrius CBS 109.77]
MNPLQRPALGQRAEIGSLYDSRNDAFLPIYLFTNKLPPTKSSTPESAQTTTRLNFSNSYKERFSMMGIEPELGASILAGIVKPGGSGLCLNEMHDTNGMLQAAIHHKFVVLQDRVDFSNSQIKDLVNLKSLQNSGATHAVIGVDWGAYSILNIRHWSVSSVPRTEQEFRADVERICTTITHSTMGRPQQENLLFDITAYSDTLLRSGIMIQDLQEAFRFIELIPPQIEQENNGKGWPMVYTMLPISTLFLILGLDFNVHSPAAPPSSIDHQSLCSMVELFDELHTSENMLQFYRSSISRHKHFVAMDHVQEVEEYVQNGMKWRGALQKRYAKLLLDVRGGKSSLLDMQEFRKQVRVENDFPSWFGPAAYAELTKLEFISMAVNRGAKYVGYNGVDLKSVISLSSNQHTAVLFFSSVACQDLESWDRNKEMFLALLDHEKEKFESIAIFDCDSTSQRLSKARISQYFKGHETVRDLVAREETLGNAPIAKYADGTLELNVPKPLNRRPLKVTCPKSGCSPKRACDWICSHCLQPLEYGHTDQYVYCDCGRSWYSSFEFKCNGKMHRKDFSSYDHEDLFAKLINLKETKCLNILILGETGVGKSTFINAFVNYLTFETLEDAKSEDLNWVVPCSFSIQHLDKSGGAKEIKKFDIKVGNRDDEVDGSKGLSATQQTTVYPVNVNGHTIRLFDTPGIGDTRGISYDKENMADLLSTLSGYEKLHGILILLKSNNSRLTVTFNFCMNELLTHLHRSAAANMAFGFTNTRISDYNPGDTFGPLSALLADHAQIGLSLTSDTAYCFDSESFRYLAALKNNVPMDNEEDYHRSWTKSREEAMRLIEHFKAKLPHSVKSTVSLNGTRQLVLEMTKPMAEISQLIRTNITMCEDRMQELRNSRLTGADLLKHLHLDKMQLESRKLASPRTVCTDASCIEYKDDGKGENKVVVIYKTHCHPQCYLTDVTTDQIAHPGLIRCAAFNGHTECNVCAHHWQKHLHVLYELEETVVSVKNTEVERQLVMNANEVILKKTAVKELEERLKEYRHEHQQIQETTAKFGVFLKKNSITPYNDATLAYLDLLIQGEKEKIQAGGNKARLRSLENDRTRHTELVDVLTKNMATSVVPQDLDEKNVEKLVTDLYTLKHFGENLKRVNTTISSAHQATYRERPHLVQPKNSVEWNDTSWSRWTQVTKSRKGKGQRPKYGRRGAKKSNPVRATGKQEECKHSDTGTGASSLTTGFKNFMSKVTTVAINEK